MSSTIAPGTVKKSLSVHAAIGLLAGALLYIVSLTGTVAVLYQELQRVEQPDMPEMAAISSAAVQSGVEAVLASEAGKPPTTHLYVHLPVEALPRTTVTTDTQAVHLTQDARSPDRKKSPGPIFSSTSTIRLICRPLSESPLSAYSA